MPLQSTSGAASYDAFGGGVAAVPKYIEDYFSTFLYSGTSASQTITNGIDLSTKGGLVWMKDRSATRSHCLADTANGAYYNLFSDLTNGLSGPDFQRLTSFNSNGFSIGSSGLVNNSGGTYTSWSWAKAPKFFDIVTYTGTGSDRTVAHSLGSTVGCIFIKAVSGTGAGDEGWRVYHRSQGATKYAMLQSTNAFATASSVWNNTEPTSSNFTVGTDTGVNGNGLTFVAYIFAHDAGGFGLTGTDNVISCGSFSGNTTVDLGYEPQWVLLKNATSADNWYVIDNMRGWPVQGNGNANTLQPNTSVAEQTGDTKGTPTATGFTTYGFGGSTGIYIAIRRGPMKVPTSGTSVFAVSTASGEPAYSPLFTAGFSDMTLHSPRVSESGNGHLITDRLRGNGVILETPYTNAENTISTYFKYDSNDGAYIPNIGYFNNTGGTSKPYALRAFKRAPSFFDEVCYTGTGGATTVAHNLGAVPQLILVKQRTASPAGSPFTVYSATLGNTGVLFLNSNGGNQGPDSQWNSTTPTSSVFSLGSSLEVNQSGSTFVAYLFSTCAGVSKVGSYTGTGTTLQVDCGFTSGARFVLIKRNGTGDWYVWDSARGIVSGNDSYLLLNSTAAEVTNTDYIDTYSAGFEISSTAPAAINASGGSFIFFAVA